MNRITVALIVVLICFGIAVDAAFAQRSRRIDEEILSVPTCDSGINLEVTVVSYGHYEDTHAPIVIINHGTNPGGEQGRERAVYPTKFFLHLGYTVVLPMRRGYSNSGGRRASVHDCDLTEYGLDNARDIEDVVIGLQGSSRFRNRKIIMIGQSTGGLATMAYSSLPKHRVNAIINFHGGMRPASETDCKWEARIDAFRTYALTSEPESLWLYTANDHSSTPAYIRELFKAFIAAGGHAKLIQLPAFEDDGHYLFSRESGGPIWQPIVLQYLKERNLLP